MSAAAAIAAAASASPMACGSVPIVAGRILLVDGDGLAYYCAGKDDTDAGEARGNLVDKVRNAQKQVGAETVRVLLTASGSNKGHRYSIARVKPYQGQRTNSKRPVNWQALRDFMEGVTFPFQVESTKLAEADDLFGWYAYNFPEDVVIYTQDKDMRMLPGMHLDWVTHRVHQAPPGVDTIFNDKQYGIKWFWLQMLHGDTADNIPGLPKYKTVDAKGNEAFKPVGEVTANKLLASESLPHLMVAQLYRGYYGERWLVEMLEQACLLWMRRTPKDWDDCLGDHGPLALFADEAYECGAYDEILKRVTEAQEINDQIKAE